MENVGIVDCAYNGEKGVATGLSIDVLTPEVLCAAGVDTVLWLGSTGGTVLNTETGMFCC